MNTLNQARNAYFHTVNGDKWSQFELYTALGQSSSAVLA